MSSVVGLVVRVAAVAGEPRVGPRCATFGPRSLGRQRVGVAAKATLTWAGRAGSGARRREARRGRGRAGGREAFECYELMR
jgi:hypothetical protein